MPKKIRVVVLLLIGLMFLNTGMAYAENGQTRWWESGRLSPGTAYLVLAKETYLRGDYKKAELYGVKSAGYFALPSGGQGEAYLIAYMAAKQTGSLVTAGLLSKADNALAKSGQVKQLVANGQRVDNAVSAYKANFTTNLRKFKLSPNGLAVPPEAEIIQLPGLPAIFKYQLYDYWLMYKDRLGTLTRDYPNLTTFIKPLETAIQLALDTIAKGKPVSPERAAAAGVTGVVLLLVTNLVDVVIRRRPKLKGAINNNQTKPVKPIPKSIKTNITKPAGENEKFEKPPMYDEVNNTIGAGKDPLEHFGKNLGTRIQGGDLRGVKNLVDFYKDKINIAGQKEREALKQLNDLIKKGTRVGVGGQVIRTNFPEYEKAYNDLIKIRAEKSKYLSDLTKIKDSVRTGQKIINGTASVVRVAGGAAAGAGVLMDTLSNMSPTVAPDGTYIAGDDAGYAIGKAVGSYVINNAIGNINPQSGLVELGNTILFGGTKAGDIMSFSNTTSGTFNYLADMGKDYLNGTNTADLRREAGVYGQNVKNFVDAGKIINDAATNPEQFSKDWNQIATDKQFYKDMHNTVDDLFKTKEDAGTIKRGASWVGRKVFGGFVYVAEGAAKAGEWAGDNETIGKTLDWFGSFGKGGQ